MINLFAPSKFTFTVNGQEVIVQKIYGGKNSPPKLAVTVKGQFGGQLRIRYETGWDRFCKNIGLDREPQIPDRQTNDTLYFECDDQDFVNRIFLNSELKAKILDLLAQGYTIDIKPQKCVFTRNYIGDKFEEKECEQLAKTMASITMPLPPNAESAGAFGEVRFDVTKILMLTLGYTTAAMAAAAFCFGLFYPVSESALCWRYASQFFVPAILAAIFGGFAVIRGFATSSKVYTTFLVSFCIGAVILAYCGTQYVNGKYDQGSPSTFIQPVIDKYTTTSKNSTTYHVVLAPWRDGGSGYSFTVGSNTYAGITTGATKYTVTTKPGALGLEWINGYERYTDPENIVADNPWPPRDYSQWYPLPNVPNIDPAEMAYWRQWLSVIEEGITNRMNAHDQLNGSQRRELITRVRNEFWRRQTKIMEQLTQIHPPERLRTFHDTVISAGHDQIDFYVDFGNAKEDNTQTKFENVSGNAHLHDTDQKLWAAYHQFESLYPQRSQEFNDAIERRLAWFDII